MATSRTLKGNKGRGTKNSSRADLRSLVQWTRDHERHDDGRFESGAKQMALLATKEDMQELKALLVDETGEVRFATKHDVSPVIELYNTLAMSGKIVSGGGKWFSRAVLVTASLIIAFGVISGGFKAFLAGIIGWVMHGGGKI